MIREDIARVCNHKHTRDGYSIDWEDLKEYERMVFLNDADQIINLIVDKLTVIGDEEVKMAMSDIKNRWLHSIGQKDTFEHDSIDEIIYTQRWCQRQHTIKEIKK